MSYEHFLFHKNVRYTDMTTLPKVHASQCQCQTPDPTQHLVAVHQPDPLPTVLPCVVLPEAEAEHAYSKPMVPA